VVDVSRSRVLYRAARKHNSQALEADALHFSTDIWSSAVVILGLICVAMSQHRPAWAGLYHADAVAAICVALITLLVVVRLGLRTLKALLDAAPRELAGQIVTVVEALPGVHDCHRVRTRFSGPQLFIDVHVLVDGGQSLQSVHDLTEQIEAAIRAIAPASDVTVHPEPLATHHEE
jgi:cation diffusion facilitator family transporter